MAGTNTPLARHFARLALAIPLVGGLEGCTAYLVQQQGNPWPAQYPDCPSIYTATRMEIASVSWAFSGESAPPDSCLAHYYPKATQDPFYRDMNQWLTPLYFLSLPMDVLVDTITLPFAAAGTFSE